MFCTEVALPIDSSVMCSDVCLFVLKFVENQHFDGKVIRNCLCERRNSFVIKYEICFIFFTAVSPSNPQWMFC